VNERLTPEQQLQARKYDPNQEPPPEQICMLIQSQNIGTLQNFITITGIEKAGKGKMIAAITAAAITGNEVFDIRVKMPESRRRISLWDTEQSDYHFFKAMQNIKKLAGIETFPQRFDAFCTREDDPESRLNMMERYLQLNPDQAVMIIDGLLDLTHSFNDETTCSKLVQRITTWTKIYNCFIIAVLHRSKNTGSTIGHLGAFANRKAQSVLLTEKDRESGCIVLKPEYLRDSVGFAPIAITYDNHLHNWVQTIYEGGGDGSADFKPKGRQRKLRPSELDMQDHKSKVLQIFNSNGTQKYGELVDNIEEIYAAGTNWAKECVSFLLTQELIFKTVNGYTNSRQAKLYIEK
jgi:hypothetical protein